MLIVFGSFFYPISKHSFYLNAIKHMYLAKTEDTEIFGESKAGAKRKVVPASIPKAQELYISQRISKHRIIKVRLLDSICTFLCKGSLSFLNCGLWKKRDKFIYLFREGRKRIDKELDIVKLIKNVQNTQILLRSSVMDSRTRFLVDHSDKKVIDLDC